MRENRVIFILIILKPKNTKKSIEFVGGKRQHIFPTTGFWFFFFQDLLMAEKVNSNIGSKD